MNVFGCAWSTVKRKKHSTTIGLQWQRSLRLLVMSYLPPPRWLPARPQIPPQPQQVVQVDALGSISRSKNNSRAI
eukprot:SAG31_NODE_3690_length_3986_cov_1.671984_4_plen_75_part_00